MQQQGQHVQWQQVLKHERQQQPEQQQQEQQQELQPLAQRLRQPQKQQQLSQQQHQQRQHSQQKPKRKQKQQQGVDLQPKKLRAHKLFPPCELENQVWEHQLEADNIYHEHLRAHAGNRYASVMRAL
jgi:hypothetical protein